MDNAWWDIEALYEECTKPDLTPGDIVWCITEYNDINPKILVSEREKANEHSSILGRIRTADINSDFNKKDKLPIYNLTLKDTEEIIVKKAKLRPCVILNIIRRSHIESEFNNNDILQLLPIYSLEAETGWGYKFDNAVDIQTLKYPHHFFMPKKSQKVKVFNKDSFLRIECIFSSYSSHIRRTTHIRYRLSNLAFNLISAICKFYLFGVPIPKDSDEQALIDLARESAPI